jgi:hypothetical protein
MTGVHVRFDHDGAYEATATNGRYLARVTGMGEDADNYPAPPAVSCAPNSALSAVIPADGWTDAFKSIPKGRKAYKPILRNIAIVPSWEQSTLATTDGSKESVSTVSNVEGRFPDCGWVLSDSTKGEPTASITVSPGLLVHLLKVAQSIATEDDSKAQRITLEIRSPNKPLVVKAEGKDGQQMTGLLMPIS